MAAPLVILPIWKPVTMVQGDTFEFTGEYVDPVTKVAVDLSGATGELIIKRYDSSVDLYRTNTLVLTSLGIVTCTIPNTETETWPAGRHKYVVRLTLADGAVRSAFFANYEVRPSL